VPFVCIQVLMVAVVLAFPGLVLDRLSGTKLENPQDIQIELPTTEEAPQPIEIQ
jgi:hypothetical protein